MSDNEPATIAKLLRALATGTDAKASRHDVIFTAAADLLVPPPSKTATNEKVPFKLFAMPCCHIQICWVNPRLPTCCPECGKHVYMELRSGKHTLVDSPAWLRIENSRNAG